MILYSQYTGKQTCEEKIQLIASICEQDTVEILTSQFSWRNQERISTKSDLSRCFQTEGNRRVLLVDTHPSCGQYEHRCIRMK